MPAPCPLDQMPLGTRNCHVRSLATLLERPLGETMWRYHVEREASRLYGERREETEKGAWLPQPLSGAQIANHPL